MTGRTDLEWLDHAAKLGRRGRGRVHPNPEVGCVLVADGTRIAEAYHENFGGPHAEVLALRRAKDQARGSTAYVSLEPCGHHGKTPPCTDALISAGVGRVVYGAADPTPEAGGGHSALRSGGIEVEGPLFEKDRARLENPSFTHWSEQGTPWVQVKLAMSVDGRISAAQGARTAISGDIAVRWVHTLRASSDAILVGRTTAHVDNPQLNVREGIECVRPPLRVVLDTHAHLSPSAAMLNQNGGAVHVFVGPDADPHLVRGLEGAGAFIHHVEYASQGRPGVDLAAVLSELSVLGVRSVLCEGGGVLASALISDNLAQRAHLVISPMSLGPSGVPAFTDDIAFDTDSWRAFDALRGSDTDRTLGRDALVSFRREY